MATCGRATAAIALVLTVIGTACGGTPSKSGDPSQHSAGDPAKAAYAPSAALVADSAFRPSTNGFPFENYGPKLPDGSTPTNLTPDDVRAMFGDRVCGGAQTGGCNLIPEAQAWLDNVNSDMAGGHCYGFSVAAELLWQHRLDPAKFGAPATPRLDIEDSKSLQRTIASAWVMQLLDSVRNKAIGGSPNDVLKALRRVLVPNPSETYTIVFFKQDGSSGHAVTPYAIENKGGGKYDVLIYDNNWPTVPRAMTFDAGADTWTYDAATNPKRRSELYSGNAETESLFLFPTSPGLGVQPCPFCGKRPTKRSAAQAASTATEEIFLNGAHTNHADLLISDDAGHRLGYFGGKLLNEIPGGRVEQLVENEDWDERTEPRFVVPAGVRYRIVVDGSPLHGADTETVGVIGPDADATVKDMKLQPRDKETLIVGADGTTFSYMTSRAKPWTITAGVSDDDADYSIGLRGVSDATHGTINLVLPVNAGVVTIDRGTAAIGPSTVSLSVTRQTPAGTQSFVHNSVPLAGSTALTRSLTS